MNIYGLEEAITRISRREKALKKFILFENLNGEKFIERCKKEIETFLSPGEDPKKLVQDKEIIELGFGAYKFIRCRISNVTFRKCNFDVCDFELCEFVNVVFDQCSFFHDDPFDYKNTNDIAATNCYFYENSFEGVVFKECDFQYSIFVDNIFEDVEFLTCSMFRSILFGSNYDLCKIYQSLLDSTFFYNCRRFQIDFSKNKINEDTVFHCSKWAAYLYVIDKFKADNAINEELPKEIKKRKPSDYRERYLTYSQITRMYQEQGFNNLAWEYYYIAKKNEKYSISGVSWIISSLNDVLCGYGERPYHTFLCIVLSILLFGIFYLFFGFAIDDTLISLSSVKSAWPNIGEVFKLYCHSVFFSITTFSTVGYGNYVPVGGISSTLAAIQMLMGISLTALWTGCVFRKISR